MSVTELFSCLNSIGVLFTLLHHELILLRSKFSLSVAEQGELKRYMLSLLISVHVYATKLGTQQDKYLLLEAVPMHTSVLSARSIADVEPAPALPLSTCLDLKTKQKRFIPIRSSATLLQVQV